MIDTLLIVRTSLHGNSANVTIPKPYKHQIEDLKDGEAPTRNVNHDRSGLGIQGRNEIELQKVAVSFIAAH